MSMMRWALGALLLVCVAGVAVADDVASLREELADMRAKMASLESAQMAPAAGGDAESLLSMKKKAAIKIGGGLTVCAKVYERDTDPTADFDGDGIPGSDENNDGIIEWTEDDDITHSQMGFSPSLKIEAKATEDTKVYFKLDLDDTGSDGDLVEEAYFEWKHVAGTNWKIWFGKDEIEFGIDESIGDMDGLVHGGATLFGSLPASSEGSPANNHGWAPDNDFPGERDNRFALQAAYEFKDLLTWYVSVFQAETGMYEDADDDTLLFQSFSTAIKASPFEGFDAEIGFIRFHNESAEHHDGDPAFDCTTAGDQSRGGTALTQVQIESERKHLENDQYAISLGGSYSPKGTSVTIFAEYLHGWDWGYDDRVDTDTVQLGLTWGVTEKIDLGIMGEWAEMDRDDAFDGEFSEVEYWNLYLTGYYTLNSNVKLGLEYMHQWFDGDLKYFDTAPRTANLEADADYLGFISTFSF